MQIVRPRLGATIPDDWSWKESSTFVASSAKANVIFSSEPLGPDIDSERYALVQGELLVNEFPGYREITFEPMLMMGGRQGYLRRFAWKPPDEVEVTQVQLYHAEPPRGYTATATTPTSNYGEAEGVLVGILESLTIGAIDAPGDEGQGKTLIGLRAALDRAAAPPGAAEPPSSAA